MKAVIDLDWLDAEIVRCEAEVINAINEDLTTSFIAGVEYLKWVRSKCEPIEEPTPLNTTCVNEWENPVYCPLVGYCQKCENK
jgi:hypothetical protein